MQRGKRERFALWRTGAQEELSAVGAKRRGTKRRGSVSASGAVSASGGEWGR